MEHLFKIFFIKYVGYYLNPSPTLKYSVSLGLWLDYFAKNLNLKKRPPWKCKYKKTLSLKLWRNAIKYDLCCSEWVFKVISSKTVNLSGLKNESLLAAADCRKEACHRRTRNTQTRRSSLLHWLYTEYIRMYDLTVSRAVCVGIQSYPGVIEEFKIPLFIKVKSFTVRNSSIAPNVQNKQHFPASV